MIVSLAVIVSADVINYTMSPGYTSSEISFTVEPMSDLYQSGTDEIYRGFYFGTLPAVITTAPTVVPGGGGGGGMHLKETPSGGGGNATEVKPVKAGQQVVIESLLNLGSLLIILKMIFGKDEQ